MSADNFIGVFETPNGWVVRHGMMSCIETEGNELEWKLDAAIHAKTFYPSRGEALVAAHVQMQLEYIVEYGVFEL